MDKLWLVCNNLHNFVDYMFFMIRNGQNQKFTHFAHILSFVATKTHRKVTSQKLFQRKVDPKCHELLEV